MTDTTSTAGIRINANAGELVSSSAEGAAGLDKLGESTRKLTDDTKRAREEATRAKEADAARRFESSAVKKQLEDTNSAQAASSDEARKFVERLKEQADALGKTKTQIEQYKAAQLDLTMQQRASVKTSLDQIEAHDKNAATIKELTRLSLAAGAAAGAYAVSTALQVKAIIDQADGFNKLSQSMGVSTQFLSAYTYQGSLAGVTQQEMSASARALVKNMQEAAAGTGNGAAVFRALGGEILLAAKNGESLETLLPKIAEKFAQFEDGPRKSALAIELFGRAGERMIPLLNGGAAGFAASAREAAEFGRIIGPDMARRSEEFNDNLTRMNALLSATKYAIANDALPWLNKMLGQMVEGVKIAGGFGNAIRLFGTMNPASSPAENIATEKGTIEELQHRRARLGGANASALPGIDQAIANAQRRLAFAQYQQRQDALASVDGVDTSDQVSRMMQRARTPAPVIEKDARVGGVGGGNAVGDYERLIKVINEKNAVQSVEESIGAKLTAAQRDALKIMTDLRDGTLKLSDTEKQNITAVLEGTLASEKANLARERYTKQTEEAVRTHAKWLAGEEQATVKLEMQNRKLAEHNQTIGLSSEQLRALTVTRAEEALAIAEQAEQMAALDPLFEGDIDMMHRRTEAAREFLDLTREGAARTAWAEQTKKMTEANDRMRDNLERGLTDSIIRGFDKGKPFARNFLDSLETMFKSAVLTPIIQPLVRPVAGAITGVVQGAIGSLFPGSASGGGIGSLLGAASGANTVSGWFGGPSLGAGSLSNIFGGGAAAAGMMGAGALGSGLFAGAGTAATLGSGLAAGSAMGAGALGGGLSLSAGGAGAMGAGALGSGLAAGSGAGAAMGAGAGSLGALGPAMPYIGAALLAATALGLFDGGGGPKPSELGILGSPGQFYVSQNNVPGGEANLPLYNTLNARLNDPKQFDQAILAQHVGYMQGQPGEDANSMFQKLVASIAPAAQAAQDQINLQTALLAKQDELKAALGSIGPQLAEKLGIGTLQAAQNALATSEYNAPLDRFSAAKAQLDATYGSAIGGDLTAVQSFPQMLQSALTIGRDVYASGPEFADFFKTSNRMLQDLLDHQKEVQTDILRDLPATVIQASSDQVSAIRQLKSSLESGLENVTAELRRLNAA